MSQPLDLNAYLARIKYAGPRTPHALPRMEGAVSPLIQYDA